MNIWTIPLLFSCSTSEHFYFDKHLNLRVKKWKRLPKISLHNDKLMVLPYNQKKAELLTIIPRLSSLDSIKTSTGIINTTLSFPQTPIIQNLRHDLREEIWEKSGHRVIIIAIQGIDVPNPKCRTVLILRGNQLTARLLFVNKTCRVKKLINTFGDGRRPASERTTDCSTALSFVGF